MLAISARIFGLSSWSMLVPQALEGVAMELEDCAFPLLSGLVLTSATGVSISSWTRWMYLIAWAGRSAHERAPAVVPLQPSISS